MDITFIDRRQQVLAQHDNSYEARAQFDRVTVRRRRGRAVYMAAT